MKKRRNIFFKFFLFLVLFFYQGINAQSNSDTQRYSLEVSNDTDNHESKLSPENDSSEEDQIDQPPISDLSEQPESQKFGINALPLLNLLFISVWQPPKIF